MSTQNKQFIQSLLHLYECQLFVASKYDVESMNDAIFETKFKEELFFFLYQIYSMTYWMRFFTKLLSIT